MELLFSGKINDSWELLIERDQRGEVIFRFHNLRFKYSIYTSNLLDILVCERDGDSAYGVIGTTEIDGIIYNNS